MTARNPFLDTKLEYEIEPVLWFSERCSRIAARGKSTFVSGTRGSGKTSILRSLSTRYIDEIPSLTEHFSHQKLDWFGVYIRLQDSFADVISEKPEAGLDASIKNRRTEAGFTVFSQYVELLLLSALATDLVELRKTGFLKFSAGSEYDAMQALFANAEVLKQYAHGDQIETLAEFAHLCRSILDRLFEAALDVESRVPRGAFIASVPGQLISLAAKYLLPLAKGERFAPKRLRLKLMVDDCELLPLTHQAYLNTLIRNTSAPVSWVIAYVGNLYDSRLTVRANQMLSDADREIEPLDEVKEQEFKQLCTRIASLRLYSALSPETRVLAGISSPIDCFNIARRLGRLSLNDLIERSFSGSLSEATVDLKGRAKAWKDLLDASDLSDEDRRELEIDEGSLPYTVAIAADHLSISLDEAREEIKDARQRKNFERRLARKQRAAFLVLGKALGTRMLLAGEGIVIALSDGCIRDFLDLMREIFKFEVPHISETAILRFIAASTPIDPSIQSAAIYESAQAKVRGVMTIADPYGVGVTRLVEALGHLTAELQTGRPAVRNPERGLFRLNWPRMKELLNKLRQPAHELDELFRKSELDGFVREVDEVDRVVSRPDPRLTEFRLFRLHRRFAPAFGFSFRGPYSVLLLPETAFVEVLVADASFVMKDWVKKTLRKIESDDVDVDQLLLPGMESE